MDRQPYPIMDLRPFRGLGPLLGRTVTVLIGLVIASTIVGGVARARPGVERLPVIVIDPGHGGNDSGAVGSDDRREKDVVLLFGTLLQKRLAEDSRTVLTRSGDYWVDVADRTALANNTGADLFVSVHAAGGFGHASSGIKIYYYNKKLSTSIAGTRPGADAVRVDEMGRWSDAQTLHGANASRLAAIMGSMVSAALPDVRVRTGGLPLAVLEGAEMPAVLIEIGYLTNPLEAEKLSDNTYLNRLVDLTAQAVRKYYKQLQNVE